MMRLDAKLELSDLKAGLRRLWEISAHKIMGLEKRWNPSDGAPVFTAKGRYTARGWTQWTEGFVYGSALLQFEATGEREFLNLGRRHTLTRMPNHVTHFGVHDHGFNNVSSYGNLLRLIKTGMAEDDGARGTCELALRTSGAVQANRWAKTADRLGYIYSFNGPHSLFADTIRSLRALALAHALGQHHLGENDRVETLLQRLEQHARCTARYAVYYGQGRDIYDRPGRVAHESIFNPVDGQYRCPSSQQGYSPFSTWTRGLAWILLGFAEQLEFLKTLDPEFLKAAQAAADFYIESSPLDGIPYWDTGAPGLHKLGDYLSKNAQPFNAWEPVDSSAAAIAAQGLLRLGRILGKKGRSYWKAGLTISHHLLSAPYLSEDPRHEGLLLHSVYHRPNGWDFVPKTAKVPCGESSQWGDYHLRELALYLQYAIQGHYHTFFAGIA